MPIVQRNSQVRGSSSRFGSTKSKSKASNSPYKRTYKTVRTSNSRKSRGAFSLTKSITKKISILRFPVLVGVTFFSLYNMLNGYYYFYEPIANAGDYSANMPFTKEKSYNLLLVNVTDLTSKTSKINSAAIIRYEQGGKSASIAKFHPNSSVDILGSEVKESVEKIWGIAHLQHKRTVPDFVTLTLQNAAGIDINAVIFLDDEGYASISEMFGIDLKSQTTLDTSLLSTLNVLKISRLLKEHAVTSLSLREIMNFAFELHAMNSKDISYVNIDISIQNQEKVSESIKKAFEDKEVVEEAKSVVLLNGTDRSGFASKVGKFLEAQGIMVVGLGNGPTDSCEKSVLITSEDDSLTSQKLSSLLNITENRTSQQVGIRERSDITVLLCSDLNQNF